MERQSAEDHKDLAVEVRNALYVQLAKCACMDMHACTYILVRPCPRVPIGNLFVLMKLAYHIFVLMKLACHSLRGV